MDLERLHLGVDPRLPPVVRVQEITARRVVQAVVGPVAEMRNQESTTNDQTVMLGRKFGITPLL